MASSNGKDGGAPDVFGRTFRLKAAGDLKQRDTRPWNRVYLTRGGFKPSLSDERQAGLEAAIEAGWIVEPEARYEDVTDATGKTERRYFFDGVLVEDMRPAEVMHYGLLCIRVFEEATAVPKVSSLP